MPRGARTLIIVGSLAVLTCAAAWHVGASRAEADREAWYRARLTDFQESIQLGLPRERVKQVLAARKISYLEEGSGEILVKVGIDPHPLCDFTVYVMFDFDRLPHQAKPSALDNLRSISLYRRGEDCL